MIKSLRRRGIDIAMGGVVYKNDEFLLSLGYEGPDAYLKDENEIPVLETVRKANPKMLRFLLEWQRPEKWGKHPKIDVPQKGGVARRCYGASGEGMTFSAPVINERSAPCQSLTISAGPSRHLNRTARWSRSLR
jgi:hypothetical protein